MLLLNGLSHRLAPGQLLIQRALVEALAAAGARRDATTPSPTTRCRRAPTRRRCSRRCAGCSGRCRSWTSARSATATPSRCACRRRRRSCSSATPTPSRPSSPATRRTCAPARPTSASSRSSGGTRSSSSTASEHLRERRLLQPPFHGDRMLAYGTVMRDIAAARRRALAASAGRSPLHPRDAGRDARRDPAHRVRPRRGPGEARAARRAARPAGDRLEPAAAAGRAAGERQRAPAPRRASSPRASASTGCSSPRSPPAGAPTSTGRADILSLLVAGHATRTAAPLEDQALRDELMTMLLAGHETTATALAWAVSHVLGRRRGARAGCSTSSRSRPGAARPAAR